MPLAIEVSCFQWAPLVGVGLTSRYGLLVRFPLGPSVVGLVLLLETWLAVTMSRHDVEMGDLQAREKPSTVHHTNTAPVASVIPCLEF